MVKRRIIVEDLAEDACGVAGVGGFLVWMVRVLGGVCAIEGSVSEVVLESKAGKSSHIELRTTAVRGRYLGHGISISR